MTGTIHSPQGSTPVPDPTTLTQEALRRDIGALERLLEVRLDGMDKAVSLRERMVDQQPAINDKKIEHLRELHNEKFNAIQLQFVERDVRTEQTSRDSKVAVDAALQAAKEAVSEQNKSSALAIGKSDAATTKQIDTMGTLIQSTIAGINSQIGDLKERLTRIEGEGKGHTIEASTNRSVNSNMTAVIGLVVGSLIGLGGLLVAFMDNNGRSPAVGLTGAMSSAPTLPPQIIVVPFQPAGVATPPSTK